MNGGGGSCWVVFSRHNKGGLRGSIQRVDGGGHRHRTD